jgi:hypothetical protein
MTVNHPSFEFVGSNPTGVTKIRSGKPSYIADIGICLQTLGLLFSNFYLVLWCNWQHVAFWSQRVEVRTLVGQHIAWWRSWYLSGLITQRSLVRVQPTLQNALVVELVDMLDLGSSAARCESSSLSGSTLNIW